jgi:hypothetical protein
MRERGAGLKLRMRFVNAGFWMPSEIDIVTP